MAGKYILIPHAQNMRVIALKLTLKSLAISYQENQPADLELWNGFFAPISLLSLDQFINRNIQNIVCSLYRIALFGK